jgi:hypothetical protein
MIGTMMATDKKLLSLILSLTITLGTWPLESCKESSKPVVTRNGQPVATDAVPTADELYQLVAPIALFPDNLLAQVLAASTFPDQVTAAWNYLQQNQGLKGPQLMQSVDGQSWDNSVKGLTQFPDVLQQMSDNLSWTSSLGDAYFNSPQNVMNAVQVMRQRAYQAGNLKDTPQQNVAVQNQAPSSAPVQSSAEAQKGGSEGGQVTVVQAPPQTIVIQPSQPDVVYVPQYNPTVVYGAPVAPYPGYSTAAVVTTGLISFGVGMMVGAAMSGGCCGWGYNSWGCGWNNASVTYNKNTYISTSNTFANRSNYNRNNANYSGGNRPSQLPARAGGAGGVGGVGGAGGVGGVGGAGGVGGRGGVGGAGGNRGGDFGSTPKFDQSRNQAAFRDQGRGDQGVGNRGNAGGSAARPAQQPNFNGRNQAGGRNQPSAQARASTTDRQAVRGYGDGGNRGGNNGLGNYSQGGNARADSSRGQQSLNNTGSNRGGGGGGANRGGGGGANRGGGGRSANRGGGGRR